MCRIHLIVAHCNGDLPFALLCQGTWDLEVNRAGAPKRRPPYAAEAFLEARKVGRL
jgi:hypothetical protein